MKTKNLFTVYLLLGCIAAISTQALPLVYSSYGFSSNQIYSLISIVFLSTIFQPILGFIIDKFFTQERAMSILFGLFGLVSICLIFIHTYPIMLFAILISSIFRAPLFAIVDGYTAGQSHKHSLNMGFIRAGSTVGYGIGILVLIIFLSLFGLTYNYTFLLLAIFAFATSISIEVASKRSKKKEITLNLDNNQQDKQESTAHIVTQTKWDIVGLLLIIQVLFFGFTILKVNYTTPYLMEQGYSNIIVALSALFAIVPLFILMPLFNKIFAKFRYSTLMFFTTGVNILQACLYILFPSNVVIILLGSLLTGFLFPIYTPTFSLALRKVINSKYVSTGFTAVFTTQNVTVFLINQFFVINLLNITNTTITAFEVCLGAFILALIPITLLRIKKY